MFELKYHLFSFDSYGAYIHFVIICKTKINCLSAYCKQFLLTTFILRLQETEKLSADCKHITRNYSILIFILFFQVKYILYPIISAKYGNTFQTHLNLKYNKKNEINEILKLLFNLKY